MPDLESDNGIHRNVCKHLKSATAWHTKTLWLDLLDPRYEKLKSWNVLIFTVI